MLGSCWVLAMAKFLLTTPAVAAPEAAEPQDRRSSDVRVGTGAVCVRPGEGGGVAQLLAGSYEFPVVSR